MWIIRDERKNEKLKVKCLNKKNEMKSLHSVCKNNNSYKKLVIFKYSKFYK